MPLMPVRDVSLFVETMGRGNPLVLMHGGPGADHWTILPSFRPLADAFTLVFYDHRCNGRSVGGAIESMTFDTLAADADALREVLRFEQWAVLGHSFGGMVAQEYAVRYPERVSRLVLLDTGGEGRWPCEEAAKGLERRGVEARKAELVRRWFNGEFEPGEMMRILMQIGDVYDSSPSLIRTLRDAIKGSWRTKLRPEALLFAGRTLLPGWTVMDRLGAIAAPTLVIAGQDDFIFPPAHQRELAAAIPHARLHLVAGAGHNAHTERATETLAAIRAFLREPVA